MLNVVIMMVPHNAFDCIKVKNKTPGKIYLSPITSKWNIHTNNQSREAIPKQAPWTFFLTKNILNIGQKPQKHKVQDVILKLLNYISSNNFKFSLQKFHDHQVDCKTGCNNSLPARQPTHRHDWRQCHDISLYTPQAMDKEAEKCRIQMFRKQKGFNFLCKTEK